MKTYVMFTTLTDEGRSTVKDTPERIKLVNRAVEAWGARIIGQYALFGPYDFMTILEAESEKAILRVAMELGSRGSLQTNTFQAFPIDEFIENLKE